MNWQSIPFVATEANKVPSQPGVYAFFLKPPFGSGQQLCYVMYIGKTDRTLRTRFNEYIRERTAPKGRKAITQQLTTYDGKLDFGFIVLTGAVPTPETLEVELLKALIPPWNRDLPAEVTKLRPAFN